MTAGGWLKAQQFEAHGPNLGHIPVLTKAMQGSQPSLTGGEGAGCDIASAGPCAAVSHLTAQCRYNIQLTRVSCPGTTTMCDRLFGLIDVNNNGAAVAY